MFQEGNDPQVEQTFRDIARVTKGAYCRFDAGSAHELGKLLRAVAAFAAGGATGERLIIPGTQLLRAWSSDCC
jgi:hypothetical protein